MNQTINNGVWPVMITPFTKENKIDYQGVLEILEWYRTQHVAGVFAVCQSSEMYQLSANERIALAKFVISNAGPKLGVIASGHVATNIEEQIREANEIIGAGVDAYVFVSNQFAQAEQDDEVAKKNIEILLTRIPAETFGIYECPHPYKRLISPELLQWCAATGKFTFIKDTCCNLQEIAAKIKAVEGSNLKVFNANTATLLESLKLGAAGYSGVMANFHAGLYVWLCTHFRQEPGKAVLAQDLLGLASLAEYQMYPVNAKYHMQLEGLHINLFSRVCNFHKFGPNQCMEIEQLRSTVKQFREKIIQKPLVLLG